MRAFKQHLLGASRKSVELPRNLTEAAKAKGRFGARIIFIATLVCILLLWQLILWSNWNFLRSKEGGTNYMVKAVTGARNDSAPLLVLHASHGLSNRIRAVASALAVANATGRQLHVIWTPDDHIEARFHDLFENDIIVWDSEETVMRREDWHFFDKYNYMANEEGAEKDKYIDVDSSHHIYVKSAYRLNTSYTSEEGLLAMFNTLVPTKDVRRHFGRFRSPACTGWAPCTSYIGVHVRHTDPHSELKRYDNSRYDKEAWEATKRFREMSGPHHFISELKRILAKKSMFIFVATDEFESLKPFIEEFGDRVMYLEKNGCYSRRVECIKLALADLLLLGHSSHEYILGSYWSSFTEVASFVKNLPVKFAGIDFVAPGKHLLKCGTSKVEEKLFDGLSIVSAAQDRHEVLHRTVATWLSEESVNEIVLVDWSSTPPLQAALSFFNDTRLRIVEVKNSKSWVLTRAFNIGFRHSSASRILKLDADIELLPGFFKANPLEQGTFCAGNSKRTADENEPYLNRVIYVHREDLMRANGFDERIETHGWEDENLYSRLQQNGLKRIDLNLKYLHHEEEDDFEIMEGGNRFSNITDVEMARNKELVTVLAPWSKSSNTTQTECQPTGQVSCECSIVVMPSGLVDYHTPESVYAATLAAYRQVVLDSRLLEADQIAQVTSFQWYEAYLRRHLQSPDKWLVLVPLGSIADRLLGIQAAIEIAKGWNWKLQIVWKIEGKVWHRFEELFKTAAFQVISNFYDFEFTWHYQGIYLDHGTDWITTNSPPPMNKYVLMVTRGPVGDFSMSVTQQLWSFLEPTVLGQGMQKELNDITVRPVLLVQMEGTLLQRIFALGSIIQFGRRLDRHVVLVWDGALLGGITISDLYSSGLHVVSSLDEFLQSEVHNTTFPVYVHNVAGNVAGINWTRNEHIVVKSIGYLEGYPQDGDELSKIYQKLPLTKELLEVVDDLQVGKKFHAVHIGNEWDSCSKENALTVLKEVYTSENLTGTAYLMVLAESENICNQVGEGVLCVPMCEHNATKSCFMRYMAAVYTISKLPHLFLFDWRHKENDIICRFGHTKLWKLNCATTVANTTLVGRDASLVEALAARKLVRIERTEDSCNGSWHLLVQIPILDGISVDLKLRSTEYWESLHNNMVHPEVKKIHIFMETAYDKEVILAQIHNDDCKKLQFVPLGRRAYYRDFLDYADIFLDNQLCAIVNADVYLGEGFAGRDFNLYLGEKHAFALSSYEKTEGGACGLSRCKHYKNGEGGFPSHDTFLFRTPFRRHLFDRDTQFHQQVGSDYVFIHEVKYSGMNVRNPCRSLRTYHNHCSGVRFWQRNDTATASSDSSAALQMSQRLDMQLCPTEYCRDGWIYEGPEILEDIE